MDTLADVLSSENVRLKKTKNNNAIIHSTNVPTISGKCQKSNAVLPGCKAGLRHDPPPPDASSDILKLTDVHF